MPTRSIPFTFVDAVREPAVRAALGEEQLTTSRARQAAAVRVAAACGGDASAPQRQVLLFIGESTKEAFVRSLLYEAAGVKEARPDHWHPLSDRDLAILEHAADDLELLPLWVDETPIMSLAEVREKAREVASNAPLALLAMDNVLVYDPGDRASALDALAALSAELSVPVVGSFQPWVRDTVAERAAWLLSHRELIVARAEWASCLPPGVSVGDAVSGEARVTLGALVTLWHEGTLTVRGPAGETLLVVGLSGSPLSGACRVRCVDPSDPSAEVRVLEEVPGRTFNEYYRAVRRRLAALPPHPPRRTRPFEHVVAELEAHVGSGTPGTRT